MGVTLQAIGQLARQLGNLSTLARLVRNPNSGSAFGSKCLPARGVACTLSFFPRKTLAGCTVPLNRS